MATIISASGEPVKLNPYQDLVYRSSRKLAAEKSRYEREIKRLKSIGEEISKKESELKEKERIYRKQEGEYSLLSSKEAFLTRTGFENNLFLVRRAITGKGLELQRTGGEIQRDIEEYNRKVEEYKKQLEKVEESGKKLEEAYYELQSANQLYMEYMQEKRRLEGIKTKEINNTKIIEDLKKEIPLSPEATRERMKKEGIDVEAYDSKTRVYHYLPLEQVVPAKDVYEGKYKKDSYPEIQKKYLEEVEKELKKKVEEGELSEEDLKESVVMFYTPDETYRKIMEAEDISEIQDIEIKGFLLPTSPEFGYKIDLQSGEIETQFKQFEDILQASSPTSLEPSVHVLGGPETAGAFSLAPQDVKNNIYRKGGQILGYTGFLFSVGYDPKKVKEEEYIKYSRKKGGKEIIIDEDLYIKSPFKYLTNIFYGKGVKVSELKRSETGEIYYSTERYSTKGFGKVLSTFFFVPSVITTIPLAAYRYTIGEEALKTDPFGRGILKTSKGMTEGLLDLYSSTLVFGKEKGEEFKDATLKEKIITIPEVAFWSFKKGATFVTRDIIIETAESIPYVFGGVIGTGRDIGKASLEVGRSFISASPLSFKPFREVYEERGEFAGSVFSGVASGFIFSKTGSLVASGYKKVSNIYIKATREEIPFGNVFYEKRPFYTTRSEMKILKDYAGTVPYIDEVYYYQKARIKVITPSKKEVFEDIPISTTKIKYGIFKEVEDLGISKSLKLGPFTLSKKSLLDKDIEVSFKLRKEKIEKVVSKNEIDKVIKGEPIKTTSIFDTLENVKDLKKIEIEVIPIKIERKVSPVFTKVEVAGKKYPAVTSKEVIKVNEKIFYKSTGEIGVIGSHVTIFPKGLIKSKEVLEGARSKFKGKSEVLQDVGLYMTPGSKGQYYFLYLDQPKTVYKIKPLSPNIGELGFVYSLISERGQYRSVFNIRHKGVIWPEGLEIAGRKIKPGMKTDIELWKGVERWQKEVPGGYSYITVRRMTGKTSEAESILPPGTILDLERSGKTRGMGSKILDKLFGAEGVEAYTIYNKGGKKELVRVYKIKAMGKKGEIEEGYLTSKELSGIIKKSKPKDIEIRESPLGGYEVIRYKYIEPYKLSYASYSLKNLIYEGYKNIISNEYYAKPSKSSSYKISISKTYKIEPYKEISYYTPYNYKNYEFSYSGSYKASTVSYSIPYNYKNYEFGYNFSNILKFELPKNILPKQTKIEKVAKTETKKQKKKEDLFNVKDLLKYQPSVIGVFYSKSRTKETSPFRGDILEVRKVPQIKLISGEIGGRSKKSKRK